MSFIDRIDRKLGRHLAIPNLMIYITATMLVVYLMNMVLNVSPPVLYWMTFNRDLIFQGEIWRILAFVFLPPSSGNVLFLVISLYFYYFIGTSLENAWGSSRFTIYYLFGVVGAILSGLISGYATNSYLNLSLFFAFAHLFPNQQVLLFFIIPIKMKYLAWLNWAVFALSFFSALFRGDWATCLSILFALLNFFLFFGSEIFYDTKGRIKAYQRRKKFQKQMKDGQDYWR